MADDRVAQPPLDAAHERRYRLLAMNSSDIVYQTAGLNIEWISPSVTTLLGWEAGELVGGPASALLSPHQDREWVALNRARLLAGEDVFQQLLLVAKDGSERWFAGSAHPVFDDVDVRGFVVGLRDIHQEWLDREELAAIEADHRSGDSSVGRGIALLDAGARVAEVNEAICTFFGHPAHYLIGLPWDQLVDSDQVDEQRAVIDRCLAGDADAQRLTGRFRDVTGAQVHGDLTVATVRDSQSAVQRIVMQIVDTTEQTRRRV